MRARARSLVKKPPLTPARLSAGQVWMYWSRPSPPHTRPMPPCAVYRRRRAYGEMSIDVDSTRTMSMRDAVSSG